MVSLGFEFRASHLIDKTRTLTAWATPLVPSWFYLSMHMEKEWAGSCLL
jgi:hypothetical protein